MNLRSTSRRLYPGAYHLTVIVTADDGRIDEYAFRVAASEDGDGWTLGPRNDLSWEALGEPGRAPLFRTKAGAMLTAKLTCGEHSAERDQE